LLGLVLNVTGTLAGLVLVEDVPGVLSAEPDVVLFLELPHPAAIRATATSAPSAQGPLAMCLEEARVGLG
jgi:hypothetical protein